MEKDKEETSGAPSRQWRNLKLHIKQHIEPKTHRQKKEIKQIKTKTDVNRKNRKKWQE